MIEPCRTAFLTFIHLATRLRISRALSNRIDAFATMTENEHTTYYQWLNNRETVFALLHEFFEPEHQSVRWGNMNFVGRKK